jgi:TfuA protein
LKPVIFLGPSLPNLDAGRILDADIRPPVKRGDLPSLDDSVKVIGIIDGVFMGEAAVGHREIIDKLNDGVKVYGASSMGALRAAELHDFGMIGIGTIFSRYSLGEIEGDDEVALIFNPVTLEPLSEPLVNMRLNIENATIDGTITGKEAEQIISCLKSIYFPKRTMTMLNDCVERNLSIERSRALTKKFDIDYVDYKKEDATKLLATIAKDILR